MAIGDFNGTDPTPTLAQFEITPPRENGLRGCLRRLRRVLEAYALVEPRGFEIEPALHALHDVVVDHPVVAKRNAGGRSASRSWRITRW